MFISRPYRRSSYEGESDEEEKSNSNFNFNSVVHNNRKLKFSPRPLFGSESGSYLASRDSSTRVSTEAQRYKNDQFYDDEHQKMDSNMSSMALHVRDKGRMKSRTIFDNELSPTGGTGGSSRPYLFMRGGRNLRDNSDTVDNSTSFMDAIANSSNQRGEYMYIITSIEISIQICTYMLYMYIYVNLYMVLLYEYLYIF
jgi:hypothetical protein